MKNVKAGGAYVEIFVDRAALSKGLRQASGELKRFGSSVTGIGKTITGVGAGIASLGAIGGAALSWPLQLAANLEQTQASFETLLKDSDKASKLIQQLQSFAAETPFQFDELADAGKKLLAFGSSAENVQDELRRIGDISSAIGAPIGEVAEIYGKARVQGRLFAEDINQLTGRGIPIIQELAKQFGVTDTEVKKLVENGQVNFGNLEQAFRSLTTGSGQFAGGMARQSRTLIGLFSTLKDNVVASIRPFGEALLPAAKVVLNVGTKIVQRFGEFAKNNKQLAVPIAAASIAAIGLGAAAIGVGSAFIFAGAAISGMGAIAGLVSTVVAGIWSPVLVPIAAVVAGVTAIGAGFLYVANQAGLIAPAFAFLKREFGVIYQTFMAAFGGIVKALQGGRFQLAANIAWSGVKVATLQGAQAVLKGVDYLWENAAHLSLRFFDQLGKTVYNVFANLPKIAMNALRGRGFENILASAFTSGNFAEMLDRPIQQAQQQLRQQIGMANRLGGQQQRPAMQPPPQQPFRPQQRFTPPQTAQVPRFQPPVASPELAATVNAAASQPQRQAEKLPGMLELIQVNRRQAALLQQIAAEGLG